MIGRISHRTFLTAWVVFAILIALADARMLSPGFPARLVIVGCFLAAWLRPERVWVWPAIIVVALVASDLFRSTPAAGWYWFQVHSVEWFGRIYDRMGIPHAAAASSFMTDAIAYFPGIAAAALGRWARQSLDSYRALAARSS